MKSYSPVIEEFTRPASLTILCFLSFIGIGISVSWSLWELFNLRTKEELLILEGLAKFEVSGAEDLWIVAREMKNIAIIRLSVNLILLIGVILMWNLKRWGFYIYLTGQVLVITIPLILLGFYNYIGTTLLEPLGGKGLAYMIAQIVNVVSSLLFSVLYGIKLRFMH